MSSGTGPISVRSQQSSMDVARVPSSAASSSMFGLTFFNGSLFATALEDLLTQLRILFECNNELRINKTRLDMKTLLGHKYGIQQDERDELEGVDEKLIHCDEYKLKKLDADRRLVEEAMIATYKDLSLSRSFGSLAEYVRQLDNQYAYREFLIENEAKNKLTRRELNKQRRQLRNHIKSVVYDANNVIDDIRRKVEDAGLNCEARSRYIESWQGARSEQHHQLLHDKEAGPAQAIEFYKQRADHEQRVHSEIEMIVNIITNETLEKVEYWMEKYDDDMEEIDLKIQIMKNNYQNAEDHRKELEQTIEEHGKLMSAWLQFKDERERAAQYRNKMNNSALMIQAWWRGLLVRQHLGPYKVSKKKEAAKGKKK